jgi:hypothetical protein
VKDGFEFLPKIAGVDVNITVETAFERWSVDV